MSNLVIHDIQSAAERAKVEPAIILRWIHEGLRATPVGRVGKRGPRDYRIFDSWLIEFLESRARAEGVKGAASQPQTRRTAKPRRPRVSAASSPENPLGPKPVAKAK